MSITTYSKFYYGQVVTNMNQSIDFSEGGPELQATLNIGSYTLTSFLVEIKRAMEAVGANVYTVTVDRETRVITISADNDFELLISSGTRIGTTAYTLIGFTGADLTGADTYEADEPCGFEFSPQFPLQSYTGSEDFQESVDASVNESTTGRIETFTFGLRKFLEFNIRYQNENSPSTGNPMIRSQVNAVQNLRLFMRYITRKNLIEFIPDEDDPDVFETLVLENTERSDNGTGYKNIDRQEDKLPFYKDTGMLTFRVQD